MISSATPLDAAQAERLLSGTAVAGNEPLSRVISAATAPARADELAGEEAAVRAFRLARQSPAPVTPVPRRRRRPQWGWALVAKVGAVVLATAGAGWALAAGTGMVPTPWQPPPTVAPSSGPPGTGDRPGSTPASAPTAGGPSVTIPASDDPAATAPAETVEALRGLCQAFVAQGGKPQLLATPGFHRLVEAAGSEEQVPAYCHALLNPTPTPTPTPTAS